MDKSEGGHLKFSFETFLSHSAGKSRMGPFRVSLISGIEKFYASKCYVTTFRRKFFVLQYRNISQSNSSVLCFRKFLVAKKFMVKREWEVSRFPFEKFLSHSAKKNW